jgi:iron complex transport system substrate-binding protein
MQPAQTSRRWAAVLSRVLPILLLFIGCTRQPETTPASQTREASDKRIVSFSPALTRMIADLGHADAVVAATPHDAAAPAGAPVVGDLYTINYEKLLAVRPTDILIQSTKRPLPDRLQNLAKTHNWNLWTFPLEELDDIARALAPETTSNSSSLGQVIGDTAAAQKLAADIATSFTAAAPGTFVDQMLQAAGGQNVLPESVILYPNLSHEHLLKLNPQIVLDITQSATDAPLNLPSQLADRVIRLDDPDALLPSSSIARMACKLAALIHPTLQQEINTIVIQKASL